MDKLLAVLLIISLYGCSDDGDSDFEVAGSGEVTYQVTMNVNWSRTTHPDGFPGGAHFSDLVGATHNANAVYWQEGDIATPGIEQMAETGGTSGLVNEISSSISLGDSEFQILGGGIGNTGSRGFTLPVNSSHSHLTVVTMIAPSPDWFIGVSGVNLKPNDIWIENQTITLYAYDAGTDSGSNYTSTDINTNPKQPISQIITSPFLVNTNIVPIGELVITRIN